MERFILKYEKKNEYGSPDQNWIGVSCGDYYSGVLWKCFSHKHADECVPAAEKRCPRDNCDDTDYPDGNLYCRWPLDLPGSYESDPGTSDGCPEYPRR